MNKTILQVPIDKNLRDKAARMAQNFGFSSLQETIRVFLSQLAGGKLNISFEGKSVKLSPTATGRYNKMIEDIDSGKETIYTSNNVKDLLSKLYGRKNLFQQNVSQTLQKKNHTKQKDI